MKNKKKDTVQTALDILVKQGKIQVSVDSEGRNVYRLA